MSGYDVEPWCVREPELDLDALRQSESIFALSNGHVGLRGNLDEGAPCGMPGSYLNSFYEVRELAYPEQAYGDPETSQTVVDGPNGKLIRLWVDDEPFDVRTGELRRHDRELDLRAGVLRRDVEWTSPAGRAVRIHSTRLVSFTSPAVAAVRYEVTAADAPVRIRIESDLVANEELPEQGDDPRAATVIRSPLLGEQHRGHDTGGLLVHRTRRSGLRVAAAVEHQVDGPAGTRCAGSAEADLVRNTVTARLEPGERLLVVKYIAYAWTGEGAGDDLAGEAVTDRDAARRHGWAALLADQRGFLDHFWDCADVQLDGDPEVQQAVRFALFHVLQAGAQAGPHPIPAKGLTGNGYDGHALWDTETYVLPMLTYTYPTAAREALRWRHATLPAARQRARDLRLAGAAFPWRTIAGEECSGYWPAGTAALHVNADIADAVLRYVTATGDVGFLHDHGLELLVETARLWCRVAHADDEGVVHIDGVTGPDEYTALVDDNVFTNLMAQRNLLGAAEAAATHPGPARRLGVTDEEIAAWRHTAAAIHRPYDERRDVHQQSAGFTRLQEWDFGTTADDDYPLFLHFPYLELYRRQVVKQADVVLAMHLRGDAFTTEQKARNFAYYEARTVRDSSLSASTQAVLAAELGHLELAHDYLGESALHDLRSGTDKSGDGLHIASLAGCWTALVMGFGGLRDQDGRLSFAPRLPSHLSRLSFSVLWRELKLRVTVADGEVRYELRDGDASVQLSHHGEPLTVHTGRPVARAVPPLPDPGPPPSAPPGRAPTSRRATLDQGS